MQGVFFGKVGTSKFSGKPRKVAGGGGLLQYGLEFNPVGGLILKVALNK